MANNIFLIGDSYTHGACVPRDATIDAILEKQHKRNTINLGTGSNTPYEYQAIIKSLINNILFFRSSALPIDPKLILDAICSDTDAIFIKFSFFINSINFFNFYPMIV